MTQNSLSTMGTTQLTLSLDPGTYKATKMFCNYFHTHFKWEFIHHKVFNFICNLECLEKTSFTTLDKKLKIE